LAALLSGSKAGLVGKWLEETLRVYPESSVNYLLHRQDQFQNPIGYKLKEGLSILFDGLVLPENRAAVSSALENILRIRAVQDIYASQAVAFVFMFKKIIGEKFPAAAARFPNEHAALELRIDGLALAAFDFYVKCREQIYEIKANERKRVDFVAQRMNLERGSEAAAFVTNQTSSQKRQLYCRTPKTKQYS
jgi:hypothetical protein